MTKITLLTLSLSSLLLTACGGGGGTSAILVKNPNGLTQNYTVPANLKSAVSAAKKRVFTEEDPKYKNDTFTINNKTYKVGDTIDFGQFTMGYSKHKSTGNSIDEATKGIDKFYHMPYSITNAGYISEYKNKDPNVTVHNPPINELSSFSIGLNTTNKQLPNTGKATYTGMAMNRTSDGKLHLAVDFSKRQGGVSGKITGLDTGTITLLAGEIKSITVENLFDNTNTTGMGFIGDAKIAGKTLPNNHQLKYVGQFFGPKAEEVGGFVEQIDTSSGSFATKQPYGIKGNEVETHAAFGGQRGNIKP